MTDRVVNQLLTELDGVEELKGVVVVAATSRPDLLDPALLRSGRIDRLVHCPFPDSAARLDLFKSIAKLSSLNLSPDVDFNVFCDNNTQNYTGADIKSILVSANMNAVKERIAGNSNVKMTILMTSIQPFRFTTEFENSLYIIYMYAIYNCRLFQMKLSFAKSILPKHSIQRLHH